MRNVAIHLRHLLSSAKICVLRKEKLLLKYEKRTMIAAWEMLFYLPVPKKRKCVYFGLETALNESNERLTVYCSLLRNENLIT